jgi:hypothetical protein
MAHEISGATGCSLQEATGLLLLLLNRGLMGAQILVYHNTHLHDPVSFAAIDLFEGFPALPIQCPVCDQILTMQEELAYDFLFTKIMDIELVRYDEI